jgi:hypothetical protein
MGATLIDRVPSSAVTTYLLAGLVYEREGRTLSCQMTTK